MAKKISYIKLQGKTYVITGMDAQGRRFKIVSTTRKIEVPGCKANVWEVMPGCRRKLVKRITPIEQ